MKLSIKFNLILRKTCEAKNCEYDMNEKKIAEILINKLNELGFIVHKYNAVTTNSIYLKLDFRRMLWYSYCRP